MDIILLLILFLCLHGMNFSGKSFHENYLSREHTSTINGIFMILVFLRHYLETSPDLAASKLTNLLNTYSHQLIVVPFLFFSGYGIMTSVMKKGSTYVNQLPRKRIFRLWYHFAIIIVLYTILNLFLGRKDDLSTHILAFTGWETIGNSGWYMFAIFFLYIASYIVFKAFKDKYIPAIVSMAALCVIYTLIAIMFDKKTYFYNTIMLYPTGMIFALYKDKFHKFMQKSNKHYIISTSVLVTALGTLFVIFSLFMDYKSDILLYQSIAALLMLVIIALCMKFSITNRMLKFLGDHIFEIYSMQRIPLSICRKLIDDPYIIFIVSAAATLVIAYFAHKAFICLDAAIGLDKTGKSDKSIPE